MSSDARMPIANNPGTFSILDGGNSAGDASHWEISNVDESSLTSFLASLDIDGRANGSPVNLSDFSISSTDSSLPAAGLDGHFFMSDRGEGGSIFSTALSSSIALADYVNDFKAQGGDAGNGSSLTTHWSGAADNSQSSLVDVGYLPVDMAGNFSGSDGLADFVADAKGGSKMGGGRWPRWRRWWRRRRRQHARRLHHRRR